MNKILLLFLTMGTFFALSAQTWSFEDAELGDWTATDDGSGTFEISTDYASEGTTSVKMTTDGTVDRVGLRNDAFEEMAGGDVLSFDLWISADDAAKVNGIQVFWQDGEGWEWNSNNWHGGAGLTGDAWNTLTEDIDEVVSPLQRIGIQVLTNDNAVLTYYLDNIQVTSPPEGSGGEDLANWSFETGELGNWAQGDGGDTIVVSMDQSSDGTFSILGTTNADVDRVGIRNDEYLDLQAGDVVSYDLYISADDLASVNGVQVYWQDGEGWDWNSPNWINGTDLTPDAWTTVTETIDEVLDPVQRIGVQVLTNDNAVISVYFDNIKVTREVVVPVGTPIILESEDATLATAVTIETDSTSDAIYIVNTDWSSLPDMSTSYPGIDRIHIYDVTFPSAGTYDLYARIRVGPGAGSDDSFFAPLTMGDIDPTTADGWRITNELNGLGFTEAADIVTGAGTAPNQVWKWINVSAKENLQYEIEEGDIENLSFYVGGREDGLDIDKIAFCPSNFAYTVEELGLGIAGLSSNEDFAHTENLSINDVSPTPFSIATQINFALESSNNTRLEVYNSVGAKVAMPLNTRLSAGNHSIQWTPNSSLTGGIYYIALTSGKERVIQRTIYMK